MTDFISGKNLDDIAEQLGEIEALTHDRIRLLERLVLSMAVGLSVDEMPNDEAEALRGLLTDEGVEP
jgi:hypothetical protein